MLLSDIATQMLGVSRILTRLPIVGFIKFSLCFSDRLLTRFSDDGALTGSPRWHFSHGEIGRKIERLGLRSVFWAKFGSGNSRLS